MFLSVIYFILAGLGLSFLVFIHELGHYIVAKRNGMRVEVFSIGFGKPIVKWQVGEVEWRFCWILFGGYVKIAGLEREGNIEPHDIKGGFYHSSPWARIRVALMGPVVNIVFAFLAFTGIWLMGGRNQPFSTHTKIVGWVDPQSEVYSKGLRPGDEIDKIDGRAFRGFRDLLYSSVLSGDKVSVQGKDVDYFAGKETPYDYLVKTYPDPKYASEGMKTFGVMQPARYLIYDDFSEVGDNPLSDTSPMRESGIQRGDRIVWVNGELIFSLPQLSHILNSKDVMISFERNGTTHSRRIPTFKISDLRMGKEGRHELEDWQYELGLKGDLNALTFIPYEVSPAGIVQKSYHFLDDHAKEGSVESHPALKGQVGLKAGDKIVSVDGNRVSTGYAMFKELQKKRAHIIVQRNASYPPMLWKSEDVKFIHSVNYGDLKKLIDGVGREEQLPEVGDLHLLKTVEPLPKRDFSFSEAYQKEYQAYIAAEQKKIQAIDNPGERQKAMKLFEAYQNELLLGIALQDRVVIYNPNPFILFGDVISDTYRTFKGLFTGALAPKWLSGPIGFVQVMQRGWMLGFKEALYWLGLISLGLGIFNLLPIPALDGGHICFSLYEGITKKRIKAKVMERLVLPFVILLIGLFIFVTFQDIMRIFSSFGN